MPQAAEQIKQSELDAIISRLYNYNSNYGGLLSNLEDKLNKLLDKRSPQKEGKESAPRQEPDMITKLQEECTRFDNNNCILERLLSHLNEIA